MKQLQPSRTDVAHRARGETDLTFNLSIATWSDEHTSLRAALDPVDGGVTRWLTVALLKKANH